jgi:hypothetical protein
MNIIDGEGNVIKIYQKQRERQEVNKRLSFVINKKFKVAERWQIKR